MDVAKYQIAQLPPILLDRWENLLLASPFVSPFLSPGFCSAVDGVRAGVYVLHLQNNGAESFLPYQYRRGRHIFGHAEKVGGHMSDHFGFVGQTSQLGDVSEVLGRLGISALRFDHGVPALCPFRYSDGEVSEGIRFSANSFSFFSERLMRLNKDFIKGVLRGERRLASDSGEVIFDWQAPSNLTAMAHLIGEKRSQFKRTGVQDGLAPAWSRNLLFKLMEIGGRPSCRLILSTLRSGDRWVASNLALLCGNTLHFWFPIFDQNFRRYSPGHILFFKVIEHACTQGITTFDFGQGISAYKEEYEGERYMLLKGWIGANGFNARLERLLQSAMWRAQSLTTRTRG